MLRIIPIHSMSNNLKHTLLFSACHASRRYYFTKSIFFSDSIKLLPPLSYQQVLSIPRHGFQITGKLPTTSEEVTKFTYITIQSCLYLTISTISERMKLLNRNTDLLKVTLQSKLHTAIIRSRRGSETLKFWVEITTNKFFFFFY